MNTFKEYLNKTNKIINENSSKEESELLQDFIDTIASKDLFEAIEGNYYNGKNEIILDAILNINSNIETIIEELKIQVKELNLRDDERRFS